MLAIIGGTGLNQLDGITELEILKLQTKLGPPSGPIYKGIYNGQEICFLARHGAPHHIPPHLINYRANILALNELGVTEIIAVNAVGGISDQLGPANLAIPDQIIDYTIARDNTYFDGIFQPLDHIDFTFPYDETLRCALLSASKRVGLDIMDGGIYAATQGPRLESAAEVERIRRDGGSMIGMTGMPEAALARELGLSYCCIALSVNWAAGVKGCSEISMQDIRKALELGMQRVLRLIEAYLQTQKTL